MHKEFSFQRCSIGQVLHRVCDIFMSKPELYVIASLTMDVDFFIVGEVKGTEAMYLINAAYTGQISAATVHSLSAQAAPEKIVDYALQATGNKYNRAELLKMIADCYHTVVNVKDYKVYEVLEIVGWDADTQSIKYRSLYHL